MKRLIFHAALAALLITQPVITHAAPQRAASHTEQATPAATTDDAAREKLKVQQKDQRDKLKAQQKDQRDKLKAQQKDQKDKLAAEQRVARDKLKTEQRAQWAKLRQTAGDDTPSSPVRSNLASARR